MKSEYCDTVETRQWLENPDIVIGIPSLNEADNIGFVARKMSEGVRKHFPDAQIGLINVDNASTDGTKEAFLESPSFEGIGKKYIANQPDLKGKGRNFYNLFHEVCKIDPEAVVVVDSDITSVTEDWAKNMIEPIKEGYDYCTPVYKRNQYDGTITNHVCYPNVHGLLGKNIRQPIGGDFAFSADMAETWLDASWRESTFHYGIDIFMTTNAVFSDANICEIHLGRKDHKPSAPQLKPMFKQVLDSLFYVLSQNMDQWMQRCSIEEPDKYNEPAGLDTPELDVNYDSVKQEAKEIFNREKEKIKTFVPESQYQELKEIMRNHDFQLSAENWCDIIYSALEHYITQDETASIVEGMLPLYMTRNASFYTQTNHLSPDECDELIKKQASIFFQERTRFLESDLKKRMSSSFTAVAG